MKISKVFPSLFFVSQFPEWKKLISICLVLQHASCLILPPKILNHPSDNMLFVLTQHNFADFHHLRWALFVFQFSTSNKQQFSLFFFFLRNFMQNRALVVWSSCRIEIFKKKIALIYLNWSFSNWQIFMANICKLTSKLSLEFFPFSTRILRFNFHKPNKICLKKSILVKSSQCDLKSP